MEEEVDFGKHKGGGGVDREEKGDGGDEEADEEKVLPEVVVVVVMVVEDAVEDVDNEPNDRPDLVMGILELNEDGGGDGSGGGREFVTIKRFFLLVEEVGRGKDEGFDDSDDGDVDTAEEDKEKWDLVGDSEELAVIVAELDWVVELQPLLSFELGSGIVMTRLPLNRRLPLLLLLLLFNIEVEDPLDEPPELEKPPATKAALPCA